jgi:hypothetical protein
VRLLTTKFNKMSEKKAEELLRKHLGKKNLTNEHIHIAAFMSCIDAINEALNMHNVVGQSEQLCWITGCKKKGTTWAAGGSLMCDDHK